MVLTDEARDWGVEPKRTDKFLPRTVRTGCFVSVPKLPKSTSPTSACHTEIRGDGETRELMEICPADLDNWAPNTKN